MEDKNRHIKKNYFKLSMDEIVFEDRNKDYGAYDLRQLYSKVLLRALIIGVIIFVFALSIPALLKLLGLNSPDKRTDEAIIINNVLFNEVPVGEREKPVLKTPPPKVNEEMEVKPDNETKPPPDNKNSNSSQNNNNKSDTTGGKKDGVQGSGDKLYNVAETEIPPKCPYDFGEYLKDNLVYPEEAQNFGVGGTVMVSFIVEKDGSISSVSTIGRKLGHGCEEEAIKAIKTMPAWVPGEQRGHKVRVIFKVPITITPLN